VGECVGRCKGEKCKKNLSWLSISRASAEKFPGGGERIKQDRKIAPLSLSLLYQYHVENPGGYGPSIPFPFPRRRS